MIMRSLSEIRSALAKLEVARKGAVKEQDQECYGALSDVINALEWAIGEQTPGALEFQGLVETLDLAQDALEQAAGQPTVNSQPASARIN